MASPQSVHRNAVLSTFAVALRQDPGVFVADRIFPRIPVTKKSDEYYVYDSANTVGHADPQPVKGKGTRGPQIDWDTSVATYTCIKYSQTGDIPWEDLQNQDEPLELRKDTTEILTERLMVFRERRAMQLATTAANYPAAHRITGGADWGTVTVDPRDEVNQAINAVRKGGLVPKRMLKILMNAPTFEALQKNNAIQEAVKYTGTGGKASDVTTQAMAQFFGVAEVIVAEAVYNTAVEGATQSNDDIWPDDVVVFYNPPVPRRKGPQFGATFAFQDMTVRNWQQDPEEAEFIEVQETVDEVISSNVCGAHIDNVLA